MLRYLTIDTFEEVAMEKQAGSDAGLFWRRGIRLIRKKRKPANLFWGFPKTSLAFLEN